MLIEQKNRKHIDIYDILDIYYEQVLLDLDFNLEGKFIVIVLLNNLEKICLTNVFEYKQQAKLWIDEIYTLKEFSQSLKKYKV